VSHNILSLTVISIQYDTLNIDQLIAPIIENLSFKESVHTIPQLPIMNSAFTQNGAASLASTLDARLNLFFKAVRGIEPENLIPLVDASWNVSKLDTMKILMNWRDCRGGKGDYSGFITAMAHIATTDPEWFHVNIENVPEYGRYLDLVKIWHLAPDTTKSKIMDHVVAQLVKDAELVKAGDGEGTSISLLAKWIPSEKKKWDNGFVNALCKALFNVTNVKSTHIKNLRTSYLTPLRTRLKIVEQNMCSSTYTFPYETVPSCAMQRYKKAFKKNDAERFEEYMKAVTQGTKKINADQVYPHDLVRQYMNALEEDPVIEAQWKVICEKVSGSGAFDDSVVVCDVSGSMSGTPMEVAIALGLLSRNKLITFSESPQLHDVPYQCSFFTQVKNVMNMPWGYNTNLEKVMDLVATLPQPIKRLYIFSDMQFDQAVSGSSKTHFQQLKTKFKEVPQIIFWNLNGNTADFPTTGEDSNVMLLSGYSPALLKMVTDAKEINPLSVLLTMLDSMRYERVKSP